MFTFDLATFRAANNRQRITFSKSCHCTLQPTNFFGALGCGFVGWVRNNRGRLPGSDGRLMCSCATGHLMLPSIQQPLCGSCLGGCFVCLARHGTRVPNDDAYFETVTSLVLKGTPCDSCAAVQTVGSLCRGRHRVTPCSTSVGCESVIAV